MTPNDISIERVFLILRMRMRLILGIVFTTTVLAAAYTFQMPKMYRATTSMNFDFSAKNPLDDRARSILAEDSYLTTQIGIIESLSVAQRVVDSLSESEAESLVVALDASNSMLDKTSYAVRSFVKSLFSSKPKKTSIEDSGDTGYSDLQADNALDVLEGEAQAALRVSRQYNWLDKVIGRDLVVEPPVNSRIVKVSYLSADRRIAALIANRFAEAYIKTSLEMIIDPARKTSVWFNEQLKALRTRLEEAQSTLTAYQQTEGIVSTDQRIDIESSHLRSLADQLAAAQSATRNAETERQKLQEVMLRDSSLMTFEPVFSNSVVQRVKTEIRDLESKLVESASTLGKNHPKIKKLNSELAAARARLKAEIHDIADGIDNAADLSRQRERDLEDAIAEQKQLVLKLKSEHDRIAVLQREVDSAQTAYNSALNQLSTTNLQSMVDQTNVAIVDYADIPSYHDSPRITKNLAVGLFAGLVLGVGIALFLEIFARRIYSKDDIIDELGVPLLGLLKKA